MKKMVIGFLMVLTTQATGQALLNAAYSEGVKIGQRQAQQAITSIQNFNPTATFKDQQGQTYYTDQPAPVNYYQRVEHGNKDSLEEVGRNSIDQNKAVAAVWQSFGNPKIKLDPNEPWFDKSRMIITNAAAISRGASNRVNEVVKKGEVAGINCQESKTCSIDYIKKSCNEATRSLKKICEKIPQISATLEFVSYPGNCQRLDVNQGHWATCVPYAQGGRYGGALLYTDMLDGPTWDDIYLCPRDNEQQECYIGYLVAGRWHQNNRNNNPSYDQGRGLVPKGCQGYIKFLHTYHGSLSGTIINETMGTVVEQGSFSHGKIVVLPKSTTQDQRFKFIPDKSGKVGVVIIYVAKVTTTQAAQVVSWTEVNCSEH